MRINLEIQNLKCSGCANTIIKQVSSIDNITDLEVHNNTNSLSFQYLDEISLEQVKVLLKKLGYPVVGEKNPVSTKAKSFVSCAIGRINS